MPLESKIITEQKAVIKNKSCPLCDHQTTGIVIIEYKILKYDYKKKEYAIRKSSKRFTHIECLENYDLIH